MEKYQSPSLSMIPLYRNEGDPTRVVMDWKQAGIRIEKDLIQEGLNVKVFTLEEKEEQVIFGIIVSEDRFSMPYYGEEIEKVLRNLAEPDNFTLTPSPDGSRSFYLALNKEQVEVLELRTALESHEILSSPSRLTIPVGRAFSDTVESLDLRFFSCFYMMDVQDYTPGMTEVLLTGFLFRTNPKDLRFLFLDQGHLLETFYDLPYTFDPPARTMSGCLQVIRWIQDEIILRLGAMEAKGAKSLDGYNASLRVDEQAYTRLLVIITPADELFQNQEFLTVLRMVREHGLMVGIHFFMQMSTPVPVTFLTKTTLCFKRAIDAETPKHRLVKNYQIKRGEHTPHFVNACYLEQSDIDTITTYLKENNRLKYMGLVKMQEDVAKAEAVPTVEKAEEEQKDDVLMFSFGDSSNETQPADEDEKTVSESPAAQWARPASLIHIPENKTAVSKEPLKELRRRRVTGYIAKFGRIARGGKESGHTYKCAKRLRKKTIYTKKTILQAYEDLKSGKKAPIPAEKPSTPNVVRVNTPNEQQQVPGSAPAQQPKQAKANEQTSVPDKDPRKAGEKSANRPRKKVRKPVLPILLGCTLLLGGTYAILRQNQIIKPVTSYLTPLNSILSGNTSPAPTGTPFTTAADIFATVAPSPDKSTSLAASTTAPTGAPVILGPKASPSSEPDKTPPVDEKESVAATASPTIPAETTAPTEKPTSNPTAIPTQEPAETNTAVPMSVVTPDPTGTPKKAAATTQPTKTPGKSVTSAPTATPTAAPTHKVTATPAMIISMQVETRKPTATPTVRPTAVPTGTPTVRPTAVPTATPTARPTAVPTPDVTKMPNKVVSMTVSTAAPTTTATAMPAPTPVFTAAPAKKGSAKTPDKQTEVVIEFSANTSTAAPDNQDDKAAAENSDTSQLPITVFSEDSTSPNKGVSSTELAKTFTPTEMEESRTTTKGQSSVLHNAAQDAELSLMANIPDGFETSYLIGDTGDDILRIKEQMRKLGYYSDSATLNDRYDEDMAGHVRTLQKLNGLPVTGEIGVAELVLLFSEPENR